jgi:hypothetical protein
LLSYFGEKFDEKGFCYDLNKAAGHIVGTVLRINKMLKRKKQVTRNYNIVWEFTAFGKCHLAGIVLLDGEKAGQNIIAKWEPNKSMGKKTRKSKGDTSRFKLI